MNVYVSRWSLPYITVAPGMHLSQKKKKTWQYFGGKGSKVILRALDWKAVNGLLSLFSVWGLILGLQFNSMQASAEQKLVELVEICIFCVPATL